MNAGPFQLHHLYKHHTHFLLTQHSMRAGWVDKDHCAYEKSSRHFAFPHLLYVSALFQTQISYLAPPQFKSPHKYKVFKFKREKKKHIVYRALAAMTAASHFEYTVMPLAWRTSGIFRPVRPFLFLKSSQGHTQSLKQFL